MSAAGVLSAVIARLEEFLLEEGAPAKCGDAFKEKLRTLVTYLRELEPLFEGRHNDNDFGKQVTRLAYDIEDSVEREAQSPGGIKYLTLSGNKTSLRSIKKRIDELIKLYPKLPIVEAAELLTVLPEKSRELLNLIPGEDDTVGLEDDLIILKDMIMRRRPISKAAIVGMAGVGKTVLARKLFDHPTVNPHFDRCAWACVSQESNVITVMRSILKDISSISTHDLLLEPSDLMVMIHRTMYDRRCLVILDDVWSLEIWDNIRYAFPQNDNGSIVVITSRDEGVARSFQGDVYRVPFLTNTESDELLEIKLGLHHSDMNKNASLRSTMNTIISMCQGLPLEIIRIVDILKITELEKWENVVDNLLKSENGETSLLRNIALSYDYLQPHLKPCFLSLGLFPCEQPISVEKLHLLWKAERFAVPRYAVESYLGELADRNLTLVTREKVLNEELVSYQLQIMTRKLCILKGKEEGFIGIFESRNGSTAYRAATYLNANVKEHDIISNIHIVKHTRVLLFFSNNGSRLLSQWPGKFSILERFERARVLDFDGVDLRTTKLSTCKGKLLHLRYLSFGRCYLEEYPFSFWIFPFLETLDLRVRTKMIIPNVLWKMSNLRNLYFPVAYECKTGDILKLKGAKKLEVIENFHAGICDVDDLLEFKNLKNLKIISDGENTELKQLIKNVQEISDSHSPIKSSLVLNDFDCYSSEREETLKKLLECSGIRNLYLEGCINKMPRDLKIAQNFTEIVLDGTELRQDPMPMLGELESLKRLVLCNDAVCVEEIACCEESFPGLESLELNNLKSLKIWVLESEMPNLTVLTIKHCHNLVTLPENLTEMYSLKQFIIGSMSQEFKQQVDSLVEEQLELGNDWRSVIYES